MSFTQIIDNEYEPPIEFRKFKKSVHNGTEWEVMIFYETKKNVGEAERWLNEKYGRGIYCKNWWRTHTSVCMSEKIYTHYALSVL